MTWAPSPDALRAMLQQKKFVDLSGSAEQTGDLKSVVLHSMTLAAVKSDFDIPVGVKLTGVDNSTYSLTGQPYSAVVGPNTESNTARLLQKDDVALAYEFSRKFPGYTAENLTEKGIHEVQARRFCLIAQETVFLNRSPSLAPVVFRVLTTYAACCVSQCGPS